MGTDARVLVTGFATDAQATAAADAVRPSLMGPTQVSRLGTHRPLDPHALCWGVEPYCDGDGRALIEVSTGLRWHPDPHNHVGLAAFVAACAAEFPGRLLYYSDDSTTAELRFGDRTFAGEVERGTIRPLPAT